MREHLWEDRQALIRHVSELAESYTPEWRFNGECADIGSALALLYCGMFEETLQRLPLAEENVKIDFLNLLGAQPLPPSPAAGVVSMSVAEGDETGTFAPKGSLLKSNGGLLYETLDDVFVTPAQLTDVIQVRYGTIIETAPPFRLFRAEGTELREHYAILRHDEALRVTAGAVIRVGGLPDCGDVAWLYGTKDGFIRAEMRRDGNCSLLTLPGGAVSTSETEIMGQTGFFLRAEVENVMKPVSIEGLTLASSAKGVMPEAVIAENAVQDDAGFYPFGKRFSIYNELYIFSDEVFGKRGGRITLHMRLSFRETAMESDRTVPEVDWKNIVKKRDYNPVTVHDITINEVLWEYWNGRGWMRVLRGGETFFSHTGDVSISFDCPNDIEPVETGSAAGYGIRARVWSVENAYRAFGKFISPWCEGVRLDYESVPSPPQWVYAHNNGAGEKDSSFLFLPPPKDALYFGFDRPFGGCPARFWFDIESVPALSRADLLWERQSEGGLWEGAAAEDGTGSLTAPGTVSFSKELTAFKLFGRRRYWLRVRDIGQKTLGRPPLVRSVIPNVTDIMQRGSAGAAGNLPAGSPLTPAVSMGFINSVRSIVPMRGGADAEDNGAAVLRCAGYVRHGGRAVTLADYEALAMESCREIVKARPYAGVDADAAAKEGAVTIVVLCEEFSGLPFAPVRRRVLEFLRKRCPAAVAGVLDVVPARLVRFNITAVLARGNLEDARERLTAFFHPLRGGFDGGGWEIGTLPTDGQIRAALALGAGSGAVGRFSYSCRNAGEAEDSEPAEHPFALPVSGEVLVCCKGI